MRSKLWIKKRESLERKEKRLKEELTVSSEAFESQVKKTSLVVFGSGLAIITLYQVFKYVTREEKKPEEKSLKSPATNAATNAPNPRAPIFSLKRIILEKAISAIVKFATTQMTNALSEKLANASDKSSEAKH